MKNKKIPKKYMLILQRRYVREQEVLEFDNNGDGYTVPIISFTDIKKNASKSNKSQKQTLAFFDAITNKFVNLSSFLNVVGSTFQINPDNFKEETSYIGFLNNGRMNSVRISFGDKELADIAMAADGNNININDKKTMTILEDIMSRVEDKDSDFVSTLNSYYENQDRKSQFNLPTKLVEDIKNYRNNKINYDYSNLYRTKICDEEYYDLYESKSELLNDLKSYKNFRELYRFRKWYIKTKGDTDNNSNNKIKKNDNIDSDNFRELYEEVRQKSYPRQKKKSDDFPGQMSIFDLDLK